jgi:hypothetical protein
MELICIAMWESQDYIYQGFGNTPSEAKKVALRGYSRMCKKVSGHGPTAEEKRVFNGEVSVTEVHIGKCLIDVGRQGWL